MGRILMLISDFDFLLYIFLFWGPGEGLQGREL